MFESTLKNHFYFELFFHQNKLINNIDKLIKNIDKFNYNKIYQLFGVGS